MTKRTFDKIAAGLNDAIAIVRGQAEPARLHIPKDIDVKAIRHKVGLSQDAFAAAFGITLDQIRAWEQGRSKPLGGVRALLLMIDADHQKVSQILETVRSKAA